MGRAILNPSARAAISRPQPQTSERTRTQSPRNLASLASCSVEHPPNRPKVHRESATPSRSSVCSAATRSWAALDESTHPSQNPRDRTNVNHTLCPSTTGRTLCPKATTHLSTTDNEVAADSTPGRGSSCRFGSVSLNQTLSPTSLPAACSQPTQRRSIPTPGGLDGTSASSFDSRSAKGSDETPLLQLRQPVEVKELGRR
jgi:hypothetical protein